jgi:hypothetical protein
MSWNPVLNLIGPPIQTGTYSITDASPIISLNATLFPGTDFVVMLTPYGTPTGIPMAWVVEKTSGSFTIGCSGTPQVFWSAISSIA